jgi:hypothetical protein
VGGFESLRESVRESLSGAHPPPRTKWTRRVPHPVLKRPGVSFRRTKLPRGAAGGHRQRRRCLLRRGAPPSARPRVVCARRVTPSDAAARGARTVRGEPAFPGRAQLFHKQPLRYPKSLSGRCRAGPAPPPTPTRARTPRARKACVVLFQHFLHPTRSVDFLARASTFC